MDARRPGTTPVRSYASDFSRDETPISDGGLWVNGRTDGVDWCDVLVQDGACIGEVTRMAVAEQRAEQGNLTPGEDAAPVGDYDDPTAVIGGDWGPTQCARGVVFSRNQTNQYFQEVEIRLRTTITPHSITGYEVFFRALKTDEATPRSSAGTAPSGAWKSLTRQVGAASVSRTATWSRHASSATRSGGYINGVRGDLRPRRHLRDRVPGRGVQLRCRDHQRGYRLPELRGRHLRLTTASR